MVATKANSGCERSLPIALDPRRGRRATRVYVSGVHSGPNPSPGVGTAHAIRARFPEAKLIAVDYSPASSGLSDPVFDDVRVSRPWSELDLGTYLGQISEVVESGYWLSGLDIETRWLSSHMAAIPDRDRVLLPPERALRLTAKPGIVAAHKLGFHVPASLPAYSDDWKLNRFGRLAGWRIYVKGPTYEARRISNWPELRWAREALATTWGEPPFVQRVVDGAEESIAYAAYRGKLLSAVRMTKDQVTPEGKTWAGTVSDLESAEWSSLESLVREIGWTGGGEIECIRDRDDVVWVIDWNPRFPAWINGATVGTRNIPASLLGAALGLDWLSAREAPNSFVRVVYELPALAAPSPTSAHPTLLAAPSKHPSGMPQLSRLLAQPRRRSAPAPLPRTIAAELASIGHRATPCRVLLPHTAASQIEAAMALADKVAAAAGLEVAMAYSIKTDPDPSLLALSLRSGLLAEAISQSEAATALAAGWTADQVVMNGPGKMWPPGLNAVGPEDAALWFADSTEELVHLYERSGRLQVVGFRLRSPLVASRFGIAVDDPAAYARLVASLRKFGRAGTVAVHFHHASSEIGPSSWQRAAAAAATWAQAISLECGRPVTQLDLGGGWFPDDFGEQAEKAITAVALGARREIAGLARVVLEPGKAISQRAKALISTVLEVRGSARGQQDAVVDASIADLPQAHAFPHRVCLENDGDWLPLPVGEGRILGRICMEHDVLREGVRWPVRPRPGARVAFLDAGGYDASMSYRFGEGP